MSSVDQPVSDLITEGLEDVIIDPADRGIDTLVPATHYHSDYSLIPK